MAISAAHRTDLVRHNQDLFDFGRFANTAVLAWQSSKNHIFFLIITTFGPNSCGLLPTRDAKRHHF
jgi:hypothetical protein